MEGEVKSELFDLAPIDEPDPLELSMKHLNRELIATIEPLTEAEKNNTLQTLASKSNEKHSELMLGLLFPMLIDEEKASTFLTYAQFIVRDNFSFLCSKLRYLISKFFQLQKIPRKQVMWLVEIFIEAGVLEAEHLCLFLIRQIKGGDVTQENLQLAEQLLDLFSKHRTWFEQQPTLIATSFYSYARLLLDHVRFDALFQKEATFCSKLFREKFTECCALGRDLIRILQDVARIPEFQSIWEDLFNNPRSFSPHFTGIESLLAIPTPKKFLLSRVTPQMEEQILFIMENVKMGNQKRYQQWFLKNWISTPESESLICDLIRYICCVFHPPNSQICSDKVQRWAMIGWLLKCVKTHFMSANVKLALFFDWLFYEPSLDSIMNIEPAVLVMFHSLPKYTAITATLLEFLVFVAEAYYPPMAQVIRSHVVSSFQTILSKGVLNSLDPLFESENLDENLRKKVKEMFSPTLNRPFTSTPQPSSHQQQPPPPQTSASTASPSSSLVPAPEEPQQRGLPSKDPEQRSQRPELDQFIVASPDTSENESTVSEDEELFGTLPPKVSLNAPSNQFMDRFSSTIIALQEALTLLSQNPGRKDHLDKSLSFLSKLLTDCLEQKEGKESWIQNLVSFICTNFEDELKKPTVPTKVLFSALTQEQFFRGVTSSSLLEFYRAMMKAEPAFGFKYLLQIAREKGTKRALQLYFELAQNRQKGKVALLLKDLEACKDYEPEAFYELGSFFLQKHPELVLGNLKFIRLLVSTLDFCQLHQLSLNVRLGHFDVIGRQNFSSVIETSFKWDSFEQLAIWKLISSEVEGDVDQTEKLCLATLPIIQKGDQEVLLGLSPLLERLQPTSALVFTLFSLPSLPPGNKHFVSMVTCCWSASFPTELTKAFVEVFEEFLGAPDRSFFASGQQEEEGWKERLHGNIDLHAPLLSGHLLSLYDVIKKTVQKRQRLLGIRGRYKIEDSLFNDDEFASKFQSFLRVFNLEGNTPKIKKEEEGYFGEEGEREGEGEGEEREEGEGEESPHQGKRGRASDEEGEVEDEDFDQNSPALKRRKYD